MQKLILVGGGGHCKSCIDVIEQENKFEIAGILDVEEKIGQEICGYKIIGTDDEIEKYSKQGCFFLITVGQIKSPDLRIKLFEKIKNTDGKFATVVSPSAYVSKNATVGDGTIIMHNAFLNAGVSVGKNCIINTKALLEHDVYVGDNCHISTAAVLNGEVNVGDGTFIGSNSTVVQCVKIPPKTFIKAGSLVK